MGNFSWQQLLHQRQPCVSVDTSETRSLSYYHQVVAPSLARSLGDAFWATLVPQILEQEPAARHAVLAISALHEDFGTTAKARSMGRLDNLTALTTRAEASSDVSAGCAYALKHYNAAIRIVLENQVSNTETLLTVSLLFTCIELLQGSTDAAVKHCQHAVRVRNNSKLPPELTAAFSHMSVFPELFDAVGATINIDAEGEINRCTADEMRTPMQARQALDVVMAQGARVIRLALGDENGHMSCSKQYLQSEQFHAHRALRLWWEDFAALRRRLSSTLRVSDSDASLLRLLEVRWLVSNILLETCLNKAVDVFDAYLPRYKRIVELADQEMAARCASQSPTACFSFDMGYLPLLYIVAFKCRELRLRVRALVLLKDLSCARETIWDASVIYATLSRIIEVEHGLVLDEERMRTETNPYPEELLASDSKRIVWFNNTNEVHLDVDDEGNTVVRRRIQFFFPAPDGTVVPLVDYTTTKH